jgi:hypothetical protein
VAPPPHRLAGGLGQQAGAASTVVLEHQQPLAPSR